jgi:hypothetical protein
MWKSGSGCWKNEFKVVCSGCSDIFLCHFAVASANEVFAPPQLHRSLALLSTSDLVMVVPSRQERNEALD